VSTKLNVASTLLLVWTGLKSTIPSNLNRLTYSCVHAIMELSSSEQACNRILQLRSPRCRHLANSTKHNVMLDSDHLAPLCENVTSSTKPEVHNVVRCRWKRTGATATSNGYRKFRQICACGFEIIRAQRQTHRHTDTRITIRRQPTDGKVIKQVQERYECVENQLRKYCSRIWSLIIFRTVFS